MSKLRKLWSTECTSLMYAIKCGALSLCVHLARYIVEQFTLMGDLEGSGAEYFSEPIQIMRSTAYLTWLSMIMVVVPAWLLSSWLRRKHHPFWSKLEGNIIWFVPVLTALNYVFD